MDTNIDKKQTNFSEKLRQLRTLKGFSQENMANELGIATNTYSAYEKGSTPKLDRLEKIAEILQVTTADLLPGSPDLLNLNPNAHSLGAAFSLSSLPDGARRQYEIDIAKLCQENAALVQQNELYKEYVVTLKKNEALTDNIVDGIASNLITKFKAIFQSVISDEKCMEDILRHVAIQLNQTYVAIVGKTLDDIPAEELELLPPISNYNLTLVSNLYDLFFENDKPVFPDNVYIAKFFADEHKKRTEKA